MPTAQLPGRATITLAGEDAETFLQNILTVDLTTLGDGEILPGALLSPQGKILFDFLISRIDGGFRLDCRADVAADFQRRLMMYRLRAKVQISPPGESLVAVAWGDDSASLAGGLRDRRFPDEHPVERSYGAGVATDAGAGAWQAFRITQGIPESGDDFTLGDAFPHDALLDQLGGVGLRKGCYVGQEVVSRMHHRGTARRRFMIATAKAALPAPGTDISVDGRTVGTLGSVSGDTGLAMVRIDRVRDALDAGKPIEAGGVALQLAIPSWATFRLPDADAAGADG